MWGRVGVASFLLFAEARFVFGELLAARGFAAHALRSPPRIRVPGLDVAARPFTAALPHSVGPRRSSHGLEALLVPVLVVGVALGGAVTVLVSRRWYLRRPFRERRAPRRSSP